MDQNPLNQSLSESHTESLADLKTAAAGQDHSVEGPMRGSLQEAMALPGVTADFSPSSFAGPAWNNSSEYPGIDSAQFKADLAEVHGLLERLESLVTNIKPLMNQVLEQRSCDQLEFGAREGLISTLQGIAGLSENARILWGNLEVFAACEANVDSLNLQAQKAESQLARLYAKLDATLKPALLFLQRAPVAVIELYLQHPRTSCQSFSLRHQRQATDLLLSEKEETLISTLNPHGPTAWGKLYGQIAGHLKCLIQNPDGSVSEMGLAQASGLIRDADEATRKSAWLAIQTAWAAQEVPCASILNALAGWRLELVERRSSLRKIDFLDLPLHQSHISRQTLEAMISVVHENVEVPRRALRAIAHGMGKKQLDPWDLLAPAPLTSRAATPAASMQNPTGNDSRFSMHVSTPERGTDRRTFMQGLTLVRDAFAAVDPSFGDFAGLMESNQWIEARVLPHKRQGAHCTSFTKSRTPRVFQTYMGSISDIRTLAHEMGHAYHGWVMRDLPLIEMQYPMTLAETASVFAETAFADHIFNAGNARDRFEIAWQNAESAAAFLINIPARFEFECSFYEARKGGYVSPQELSELTEKAWKNWYGDTLSKPERLYWMTKLHFSIADVSFYNYPYTFGYLFSLGIYALRQKLGAEFHRAYVTLLRDTGRMTAEELVMKHLGQDITQPAFWQQSLDLVSGQVRLFEQMVNGQGS